MSSNVTTQTMAQSPIGNDVAIRVSNLSKVYQIYERPEDRLKQSILPRFQRLVGRPPKNYYCEFWALRDVSFEVRKGETVGIIGRNGAGKSTLLQIICGTLQPSFGEVETYGRVIALLELGSGFNPEFTGIENIYFSTQIYGVSHKEVTEKLHRIVEFADIGKFVYQPVKNYSSGMYVRLAFAVIAFSDPDILVIDEALSVGDVFFQQKCMRFIKTFKDSGGTIVFVSHDMSAIQKICDRVVLLQENRECLVNSTDHICKRYLESIYGERATNNVQDKHEPPVESEDQFSIASFKGETEEQTQYLVSKFRATAESFGSSKARIIGAYFLDEENNYLTAINGGQKVTLIIESEIKEKITYPAFGFILKNKQGEYIFAEGTDRPFRKHQLVFYPGSIARAHFSFEMPTLLQGSYTMNLAIAEGIGDDHQQQHWMHDALVIDCLKSRLVHGWVGVDGLSIKIEVENANNEK